MKLSYEGAEFFGWQKQHPQDKEPLRTVEEVLETALRTVLRQKVRFVPSGRTDAKVSARGQVCEFDAVSEDAGGLPLFLNGDKTGKLGFLSEMASNFNRVLPMDVRVLEVSVAPPGFCAMSTLSKRYSYTFPGDPAELNAFCRQVLQHTQSDSALQHPDIALMNKAGEHLLGTHDFASFQSKGGRKTTVRTIGSCTFTRQPDTGAIVMMIVGSGFLMHMVRIVAGTMLQVGCGLRPPATILEAIGEQRPVGA
jgi:tRNA pseudouridine38-40 synthase